MYAIYNGASPTQDAATFRHPVSHLHRTATSSEMKLLRPVARLACRAYHYRKVMNNIDIQIKKIYDKRSLLKGGKLTDEYTTFSRADDASICRS